MKGNIFPTLTSKQKMEAIDQEVKNAFQELLTACPDNSQTDSSNDWVKLLCQCLNNCSSQDIVAINTHFPLAEWCKLYPAVDKVIVEKIKKRGFTYCDVSNPTKNLHLSHLNLFCSIIYYEQYAKKNDPELLDAACEKGLIKALIARIDANTAKLQALLSSDIPLESPAIWSIMQQMHSDCQKVSDLYGMPGYLEAGITYLNLATHFWDLEEKTCFGDLKAKKHNEAPAESIRNQLASYSLLELAIKHFYLASKLENTDYSQVILNSTFINKPSFEKKFAEYVGEQYRSKLLQQLKEEYGITDPVGFISNAIAKQEAEEEKSEPKSYSITLHG